jgi:hypothetical protein
MRLTLAIVLASGAVASATIAGVGGGRGEDVGASPAAAAHKGHIEVHGKVGGLYPGAQKKLRVHVKNTAGSRMWVKAVQTAVGDASSSCESDYLGVRQKTGKHKFVAPHSEKKVKVNVHLDSSAPDACQGAKWPLDYAVRVKRK